MAEAPKLPKTPPNHDVVEVYRDKAGEYRWHRIARNREIVADSGEGYQNLADAMASAQRQGVEVIPPATDSPAAA